jgi:hypothetical protein
MKEVAFLESGEEGAAASSSGWRWKRQAWDTSAWPAGRKVRALLRRTFVARIQIGSKQ